MRYIFPEGLSVEDAFNLAELRDEGKLILEPRVDRNGKLFAISIRKRPKATVEDLRREAG